MFGKSALILAAIAAGALVPAQAGINASLGRLLGHPFWATVSNFAVGLLAILLVVAATRAPMPQASGAAAAPWWLWLGGCLGIVFVTLSLTLAPKLGAMTLILALFAGQLIGSMLCDQFGLLGYAREPVSLLRVAGVGLALAGVVLVELGKRG